jgi:hypothetical protein
MKALLDTDAFCKLGIGGILEEAVRLLGSELIECSRLPALPHMLRRGRLRKTYGSQACDSLAAIADDIPTLVQAADTWLEKLTAIESIDPGEAQIFAAAADHGDFVVSGDKRALRALRNVEGFPAALTGRIVVMEAILFALCNSLGSDEIRRRVQSLMAADQMVSICFSDPKSDPLEGLRSYFENAITEVAPLVLWDPKQGSGL